MPTFLDRKPAPPVRSLVCRNTWDSAVSTGRAFCMEAPMSHLQKFISIANGELYFLDKETKEEWSRLSAEEKRKICIAASWAAWEYIDNIRTARLKRERERGKP